MKRYILEDDFAQLSVAEVSAPGKCRRFVLMVDSINGVGKLHMNLADIKNLRDMLDEVLENNGFKL